MGRHRISRTTAGQLTNARLLIERHGYGSSKAAIEAVSRAGKDNHPDTPPATVRRAHLSDKQLFTELNRHEMSNLITVLKSPATYGITTPRQLAHDALLMIELNGYPTSTDAIKAVSRAGEDCDPDAPAAIVRRAHLAGKILLAELDPYEMANLVAVLERPSMHGINAPTRKREQAALANSSDGPGVIPRAHAVQSGHQKATRAL